MARPRLSVVVACYNEGEHLARSLPWLLRTLDGLAWPHEVIVIDDRSTDNTRALLRDLVTESENLRLVLHEENRGRGATVTEGLRLARGEIAGFLDIDLETSSCYILEALLTMEAEDLDVVVGSRAYRLKASVSSLVRHFCHLCYRKLAHMLISLPVRDSEAGFKFFRREAILPILEETRSPGWFWDTEIVVRAARRGLRVGEFTCLFERKAGKTSTVRLLPDSIAYLRELMRLRGELRRDAGAG